MTSGANINMPSEENQDTPLHTAARYGVPELVDLYISQGADINAVNGYMETPLITAAFWAMDMRERTYSPDHHLVCRILLDHNANFYLHEEDKKTVLHKAASLCHRTICHYLVEAGASLMKTDLQVRWTCRERQFVLDGG